MTYIATSGARRDTTQDHVARQLAHIFADFVDVWAKFATLVSSAPADGRYGGARERQGARGRN
jgi:hypothetical protein